MRFLIVDYLKKKKKRKKEGKEKEEYVLRSIFSRIFAVCLMRKRRLSREALSLLLPVFPDVRKYQSS
jgi:hypothetical protein